MVSRYREEVERARAHRGRRIGGRSRTAGRAALFSGLTVAGAMAALVLMPQRFLYSVGVAGADGRHALGAAMALLVVPALLAVLGPRINALSIRRGPAVSDDVGPLAAAGSRRDAPPGAGRGRYDGGAARARRPAARHPPHRAERPGGAARPAVLRDQRVPRGPLRTRGHRGRLADRDRGDERRRSSPTWRREIAGVPHVAAGGAVRPRRTPTSPSRPPSLDGPALDDDVAGRGPRHPRPATRPAAATCWCRATPPASSTRRAAWSTTRRWSSG